MLYLIGIGLGNEKDISLNALEAVKKCNNVYLESYTSLGNFNVEDMKKLYGKDIIIADRDMVERSAENTILKDALEGDAAFLVVGDAFAATTHADLVLRAKKKNIQVKYFHNASIINAVGVSGLELYKFGKTTSMVFFEDDWKPATAYDAVELNLKDGLHTLVLLDIKVAEPSKQDLMKESFSRKNQPAKFMTVNECLGQFLELEKQKKKGLFNEDTFVIGCARIGSDDLIVKPGTLKELMHFDFGKPLHCVIIPGKLHFIEQEFLDSLK